ncbi:MAG: hypothetical protein PF445_05550 [Melioribacteraceae bacterium]|jgi:hypothetical protein|nr:hypothetical protein [Melioribacteraceae bacterium]
MKNSRRKFLKSISLITVAVSLPIKTSALNVFQKSASLINKSLEKVIEIITSLKKEDSSIVNKVMDGKEYKFDPYFHYPIKGGIVDDETKSRVFFHCHRENEFGHFHTFVEDENGELVHLVLISMEEDGNPTALATVNRWVSDDKYVKADQLKILFEQFRINPKKFKDERLLLFIQNILEGYKTEIFELFDKRDEWIKNYAFENFREPFEDREHEVLSSKNINLTL